MAETLTLILFILGLLLCIASGIPVLCALVFGFLCFAGYALYKKITPAGLFKMALEGVLNAKTVIIIFVLIGMLTAVWRACGTIPFIIYNAVGFIKPELFTLSTFILCCVMSVLTGTSFGTAGTVGVICMSTAKSLGVSELCVGGAILSGIFFGDRCSPMSSSAMLVCSLTGTDIYKNIRGMIKTSAIPFVVACVFFALTGRGQSVGGAAASADIFAEHFDLSPIAALPAAVIVVLLLLRVNVKYTMAASIIAGCVISVYLQHMPLNELLGCMVTGYRANDTELSRLINGGGLISMLNATLIITISSSYSGIFRHTELLSGIKGAVARLASAVTPFGAATVTSIFTCMISCNQVLATMLTCQMTEDVIDDRQELALTLENTAILIAPLVPWSIAAAVPVTAVGAPFSCMFFAAYLYLVPAYNLALSLLRRGRTPKHS